MRTQQRQKLPDPVDYFGEIFGPIRWSPSGWALVRCVFHSPDKHPSLSINENGFFRCHACGESGRGVIDFEMAYNNVDFRHALRSLRSRR